MIKLRKKIFIWQIRIAQAKSRQLYNDCYIAELNAVVAPPDWKPKFRRWRRYL